MRFLASAALMESDPKPTATSGFSVIGANPPKRHSQGVGCALADEGSR